jgi:hypothetical protein
VAEDEVRAGGDHRPGERAQVAAPPWNDTTTRSAASAAAATMRAAPSRSRTSFVPPEVEKATSARRVPRTSSRATSPGAPEKRIPFAASTVRVEARPASPKSPTWLFATLITSKPASASRAP